MKDLLDVFADKVLVGDGCWEYTGYRGRHGYGVVNRGVHTKAGGKLKKAHQLMYELMVGPIPEGTELDHLCRAKHCIRPSHLEPVDHRTNLLRGEAPAAINARKTHCKRGHELVPENLLQRPSGVRACKLCKREWSRANNWKYRK